MKAGYKLLDFNIKFEPSVTVDELPGILNSVSENIHFDLSQLDDDALFCGGIITEESDEDKIVKLASYSYSWKKELK